MKKIALYFLSSLFLISCAQNPVEEITESVITGAIENAKEESITFWVNEEKSDSEVVDGSFEYKFETEAPTMVRYRYGQNGGLLYAAPGETISLAFDELDFDKSLTFEGSAMAENKWLAERNSAVELPGYNELFRLEETEFTGTMKSYKEDMTEALQKVHAENKMSQEFMKIAQADIDYKWVSNMGDYERMFGYFAKNEDFRVSEDFNAYKAKVKMDNPDLIESTGYRTYLNQYLMSNAWESIKDDEELKKDETAMTRAAIKLMDESVKSKPVRDYCWFEIANNMIYDGIDAAEMPIYERFLAEQGNETYKDLITAKYDEWKTLATGAPAPEFSYPDIKGEEVALSDLLGRVVYIDVWATWCGPCRAEHPDLEKLEAEFADNPSVAFLGISIDDDKEAWEKMVTEKEMQGIQIIAEAGWNSKINKDYLIKGIPRFILIGTDGNIIDASAPRPSSGDVKAIIEKNIKTNATEAMLVK